MTEVKCRVPEKLERFVLAAVDPNTSASPAVNGTVAVAAAAAAAAVVVVVVDQHGVACPVDAPVTAAGRFEGRMPE